ncbi:MAG TPA: PAAR-like domain-containing protein [Polyangia bacterium]
MGDTVFINGRAAVHAGSAGKSIAFPDVCLCPPTPPAGPIPTPLPNNVKAADLDAGASSVLIEGNPMGKQSSNFKQSTGNIVAQSTGGGVVTAQVQGKAYFQSFAMNVMIEGEPAVRHLDLVTHNHAGPQPPNTPPMPWLATMNVPAPPADSVVSDQQDGPDWIDVAVLTDSGQPAADLKYKLTLPDGSVVQGQTGKDGVVKVRGIKKGKCKISLPDFDEK